MNRPYKILVADDSLSIQLSIQQMLASKSRFDFTVLKANNGRQACTMAFKNKPDLILIDIEMPVMDGIKAIKKIKSNDQIKNIPIIVMSSTRSFQKAFIAGADDFLLKPINQYELLLRIQLNLKLAFEASERKKQHQLLESQKLEVITQRDIILQHQHDLHDDMNYARYIQNAIFPDSILFEELCDSYFIYNSPKNIVSGDFYWVSKKNELIIFALGDCTGHGISGALMTIAGNAFLNDIVNNYNLIDADIILNVLRTRVIKLLHQKGLIGEASNGMDIILCIYNPDLRHLQFAGAFIPIYFKRFKNDNLEIIKTDRMPVGFHINHEKPFSRHEIDISPGDIIYLFSDGYPDQFGGQLGQKFRYHQFQELLVQISLLPMNEQLKIIEHTMTNWIGSNEQTDDMLIIGLKF